MSHSSHRFHRFWDLCGPGGKVTQIAQMTQISSLFFSCPTDCTDYTDLCPVRAGTAWGRESLEFIVNSLQLISRELADELQIFSDFLGDFEEYV